MGGRWRYKLVVSLKYTNFKLQRYRNHGWTLALQTYSVSKVYTKFILSTHTQIMGGRWRYKRCCTKPPSLFALETTTCTGAYFGEAIWEFREYPALPCLALAYSAPQRIDKCCEYGVSDCQALSICCPTPPPPCLSLHCPSPPCSTLLPTFTQGIVTVGEEFWAMLWKTMGDVGRKEAVSR